MSDIRDLVERAYSLYIPRIGRRPAPMDSDYDELVRRGEVFVAIEGTEPIGVLVMSMRADHVFVENVAVDPERQGGGTGGELLAFAERSATERALPTVRLYTNAAMTENLRMYPHLGYREVGRETRNGFDRILFSKSV
ncbi:MAG TPA: GNAT family N-acetyltransferase [Solirubrobacterales bacterium]|nr:GNAT family N-acetyltransferase [Solirubrobacterales bacterium]